MFTNNNGKINVKILIKSLVSFNKKAFKDKKFSK
jgi:hypothetical protein